MFFFDTDSLQLKRNSIVQSVSCTYRIERTQYCSEEKAFVLASLKLFFGCEDAAQQVLMYVRLSVCPSSNLKF